MQRRKFVSLAMVVLLAVGTGCTSGPHGRLSSWVPHRSFLSAAAIATCLEEVSRLDAEAVPTAIQSLAGGNADGSARDRLKLACLLGRTDAPTFDPDRALQLLKGLSPAFRDPQAREMARLLARTVALERELSETRGRTAELQEKIEQLKGLERELDDSRGTMPHAPPPGAASSAPLEPVPAPPSTTPGEPAP